MPTRSIIIGADVDPRRNDPGRNFRCGCKTQMWSDVFPMWFKNEITTVLPVYDEGRTTVAPILIMIMIVANLFLLLIMIRIIKDQMATEDCS